MKDRLQNLLFGFALAFSGFVVELGGAEAVSPTALSPNGDLLLATHTGKPDWGGGPTGTVRLFKISYAGEAPPQPVLIYAASPTETRVEFDRPLVAPQCKNLAKQSAIESGRYVSAGDRFEAFRPGYVVVQMQQAQSRRTNAVLTPALNADGALSSHRWDFVVLVYDAIGQGERMIPGNIQDEAGYALLPLGETIAGWTVWDSMRDATGGVAEAKERREDSFGNREHFSLERCRAPFVREPLWFRPAILVRWNQRITIRCRAHCPGEVPAAIRQQAAFVHEDLDLRKGIRTVSGLDVAFWHAPKTGRKPAPVRDEAFRQLSRLAGIQKR